MWYNKWHWEVYMKYNDNIFSISSEFFTKTDKKNTYTNDEQTRTLEKELLQILLNKFRTILTIKNQKYNGIIKLELTESDNGYNQMKELVKLGKFDAFASQYCIYLGNTNSLTTRTEDAYYQIIWDYKTYYEQLRESKEEIQTNDYSGKQKKKTKKN